MSKAKRGSSTESITNPGQKRGYYDNLMQTCALYPSNVAVRMYDEGKYSCYTYSELFGVCEYIAQNLQQLKCNRGIIGLMSSRNVIVPCAIAAAHKCCTSFMFLDLSDELTKIASDVEFTVIVVILCDPDQSMSEQLCKKPDIIISVFGYTISFYNYGPPTDEVYKAMVSHSFIARTSGSTGEPKNIQVPVECIKPNIDDLTKLFNITPNDIIFFSTPLTFDPAMVEILLACQNGASLLIAPDRADVLFPDSREHSVTVWQTTPSKFFQHSDGDLRDRILSINSTLRVLALGGEPLSGLTRLKQVKNAKNKTKIFTLYGITEMSCWACAAELDLDKYSSDREIPLGQCLSETEIIIQPQNQEKSTGRIILVSKTRKCIILNRNKNGEEQNSLKFIDTGDLAEISNNGTIYYRGRTDDQVKRFGHKINLLYIESVVNQCPKIKASSCLWLPKPRLLVVYFSSETISSRELSDFLKCKLDDKHWPDKILRIDSLPTNPHGKMSKLALSRIYERTAERPPTLDSLRVKFLEALKCLLDSSFTYDDIKHKNFYAIGGTSFRAVSLCNKISLTDPNFGAALLSYMMSAKMTIDQIITLAFKAEESRKDPPFASHMSKVKTAQKKKYTEISNEALEQISNKKPAISLKANIEFVALWSCDTGKCVDASPTLWECDLTLFVTVGSHSGKIIVLDALYGDLLGTIDVESRVEAAVHCCYQQSSVARPCGVVGTYDGTVVCFSLDTCEVRWKINVGAMIKSKATSYDGCLYIAAYDGHIRCIDLMSGTITQAILIAEHGISADLVMAKKQYILTGTLSGVCACVHVETNSVLWRGTLGSPVFASPVLYDRDKFVVFAEVGGEIHCRTVEKGIKLWKYSGAKGNVFSSILINEAENLTWQMTFGCHDKHVYSLIVKNFQPSLKWKCHLSAPVFSTPIEVRGKILAASNNGSLNVIDPDHGAFLAHFELPAETFSTPAAFEDYVYIGCRNDRLHALRFVINL